MKKATIFLSAMILPLAAFGQSDPSGKTLAATMDVFVFPAEGQDSSQQSKDEATCYEWAVGNTGSDPFNLAKQEQANPCRLLSRLVEGQARVARFAGLPLVR
jgi:hypothetical protein